jgi:hypothetical protein
VQARCFGLLYGKPALNVLFVTTPGGKSVSWQCNMFWHVGVNGRLMHMYVCMSWADHLWLQEPLKGLSQNNSEECHVPSTVRSVSSLVWTFVTIGHEIGGRSL